MKKIARLIICLLISVTLIESPIMNAAHAGMISTNDVVETMTRVETEQKVIAFIKRGDVKNQMMSFGVSAEEATDRVAQLSDSELNHLSGEIDNSVAGGDVGGVLVIILVVVLILYLIKRI